MSAGLEVYTPEGSCLAVPSLYREPTGLSGNLEISQGMMVRASANDTEERKSSPCPYFTTAKPFWFHLACEKTYQNLYA